MMSMEVLLFYLVFYLITVAMIVIYFMGNNRDLKDERNVLLDLNAILHEQMAETAVKGDKVVEKYWDMHKKYNKVIIERDQYRRALNEKVIDSQRTTNSLTADEKKIVTMALKKAMFDTHPDRVEGKQEEFLVFNKMYQKLK